MDTSPVLLRRLLLTLEYDGTAYSGWQRQTNGPSIQEEVEKALQKATGERLVIYGASRTDKGVHALGQRAHFDSASRIPIGKWPFVLNALMPRDIRAVGAQHVGDAFHARFSARGKEYRYQIFNRPHHSAIYRNQAAFVPLPLDTKAMERALSHLLGQHDFAAFEASGGTARSTVRSITDASLQVEGELLTLTVHGNAFLYNMVRIIAGTLIYVGQGKLPENVFAQAIATGDRLVLGPTAPAEGLCLVRVLYEP